MNYGKHLLAEVVCQSPKHLNNKAFIKSFLESVIKDLGIKPLAPPKLFQFPNPGGITGYCVISESHLSIHTWPEKNYFSFDVFSCKDFEGNRIEKIIRETFKVKTYCQQILERGLDVNF